jgi:hypothetical protein
VRHHRNALAVDEDAENPGLEVNSSKPVNSVGPASTSSRNADRSACACLRAAVGLGAAALFGHQFPEPEFVDREARLGGHLQGQVDREAVGVVQGERVRAAQHRLAGGLVAAAASSNSFEPAARVRLNAVSSATAMRLIRSKSSTSSG